MPLDPTVWATIAASLATAGPQAILVAFAMALLVFARSAYLREVKRGDSLDAEVASLTTAIRDGLAANSLAIRDGSAEVAKELKALTDEVRWDIRERHVAGGRNRDAAS